MHTQACANTYTRTHEQLFFPFHPNPSTQKDSFTECMMVALCSPSPFLLQFYPKVFSELLGLLRAWRNQVKLSAAWHTDCSVCPSGNAKPFLPRLQRRTLPSLQTYGSIKLSPAPSTHDSLGRAASHPAHALGMFLWNITCRALWSNASYVNFFTLNLRRILANLAGLPRP